MTIDARDALAALLDWYVESGVDLALDETPHDRYAESARARLRTVERPAERKPLRDGGAPVATSPAASPRPVFVAPEDAANAARECAKDARDLDELAARLNAFEHAPFRDAARHFLFCAGTPGAPLMVLHTAPDATEESIGEAFSGPAAMLLDAMLAAISRDRKSAYLAYFAPWRPPGDKALTPQETSILAPFARRHVELARPEVLLLFGDAPARALLETNDTASKLRGKCYDIRFGAHVSSAFVFSPLGAMLQSPSLKPAAWRALRAAADRLRAP